MYVKFARHDADIGEACLGENAPEIIGVADASGPGACGATAAGGPSRRTTMS